MKAHKLILLFLLLSITQASYAVLPDTVYIRKPESIGLMYQELNVTTKDNYHIATWFFPARKRLSDSESEKLNGAKRIYRTPANEQFPTLIICNGDAGNMSYLQLHLAEAWTNMGFNVVTFDWRGFGASSPFAMDKNYLCYTEMLEDYQAVINTVDSMPIYIASGFTKPIFLINGEKDIRTPVWMIRKILESLPESTPRELVLAKEAAHEGKEDPILLDFENFTTQAANFLKESLPRPPQPDKE